MSISTKHWNLSYKSWSMTTKTTCSTTFCLHTGLVIKIPQSALLFFWRMAKKLASQLTNSSAMWCCSWWTGLWRCWSSKRSYTTKPKAILRKRRLTRNSNMMPNTTLTLRSKLATRSLCRQWRTKGGRVESSSPFFPDGPYIVGEDLGKGRFWLKDLAVKDSY